MGKPWTWNKNRTTFKGHKLPPINIEYVKQKLAEGWSYNDVAKELGTSKARVWRATNGEN